MPHMMVRLIDQSAGTGCHRNGSASYPTPFPFAIHPFPSHAGEAKGEGAGNAAAAAAFDKAQAGAASANTATGIACAASASGRSPVAAQSGRCWRQTRGTFRTGSVWPGPVRLHARANGKAWPRRSRQMSAAGRNAKARPGSAGPATLACQG